MVAKILAYLIVVGLALWCPAQVDALGGKPPFKSVVSSPACSGYTGPGNVAENAVLYYGLRAYNCAARGQPAVTLCTASDASCETESTDATTGALDLGAVGTTCNLSTTICTAKELFDQSGNSCNLTQATIGGRATFNPTAQGGLPGLAFAASTAFYTGTCAWTGLGASTGAWTEFIQVQAVTQTGGNAWFTNYGAVTAGHSLFNGITGSAPNLDVGYFASNHDSGKSLASPPAAVMYGNDTTNGYASVAGGSIYSVAAFQTIATASLTIGNIDVGNPAFTAGEFIFYPYYLGAAPVTAVTGNMASYW